MSPRVIGSSILRRRDRDCVSLALDSHLRFYIWQRIYTYTHYRVFNVRDIIPEERPPD